MAVTFKADHTRTAEYRFLPQDITIKPELNGRHDLPDIEWLIEDILKNGQHTPVTIRKDGERAVLVLGFSRWRAVSEINKRKLEAQPRQLRCTYRQCTEQEAYLANVSENRFRNNVSEIDDAHNIKRMLNTYAMTEEQIAAFYFPVARTEEEIKEAVKWVKKRAKLITLTKEAEQAVKDGRLKPSAAHAIARLSEEQQTEALKTKGKIKPKDIAKAAGKEVAAGPKPKVMLKTIADLVASVQDEIFNGDHKFVEVDKAIMRKLASFVGITK